MESELFEKIKLNDLIGNYSEVLKILKELSKSKKKLPFENLDYLTRCFKNLIGIKRSQYRKIIALMSKDNLIDNNLNFDLLEILRKKYEKIIVPLCKEVIEICNNYYPSANKKVDIYLIKNIADHYRYIYEINEEEQYRTKANEYYTNCKKLIEVSKIQSTDKLYLTFMLNYTVFLHDTMGQREQAIDVVKNFLHTSFEKYKQIETINQKDTILLFQMVKDNLTLWKNEVDENE